MANEKKTEQVIWLTLMHARKEPNQNMKDWVINSPEIGPLVCVRGTYNMHLQLTFAEGVSDRRVKSYGLDPRFPELRFREDMIVYKGTYYGDYYITPNRVGD